MIHFNTQEISVTSFIERLRSMDQPSLYLLFGVAVLGHGLIVPFTFEQTYDAYVHVFFADHYSKDWFSLWETRWYTGFSVTSYPPLLHQIMGALSWIFGLKVSFWLCTMATLVFLMIGMYRFSCLIVTQKAAGWAAGLVLFCPSVIQSVHIYGQLPTLFGISFLLNALPDFYVYIRWRQGFSLFRGLLLLSITVFAHHVTSLFGLIFFIAPVALLAVYDQAVSPESGLRHWLYGIWRNKKAMLVLVVGVVSILMLCIWPYWLFMLENPANAVTIPHGSRDSFLKNPSSGQMFFLIPVGCMLFLLPYIFRKYFTPRLFFFGISLCLLFLLGTGGTTPLPALILGQKAFYTLTLDRFTFWATILCIPLASTWLLSISKQRWAIGIGFACVVVQTAFLIHIGRFRSLQPERINLKPIVNFLATDQHNRWRYLTLGFGDQMAWLSTLTKAQSVDGNYHFARHLPTLNKYPVERLENSKHKGDEALKALRKFVYQPDENSLKFIFSNDKYYDPLLYAAGWERANRLDNGIMVWEKPDVPPIQMSFQDSNRLEPILSRWYWGIVPMGIWCFAIYLVFCCLFIWPKPTFIPIPVRKFSFATSRPAYTMLWPSFVVVLVIFSLGFRESPKNSIPGEIVKKHLNDLDFRLSEAVYSSYSSNKPSYDAFLLYQSTEDGLVSSYSKLEAVQIGSTSLRNDTTIVQTDIKWRTALGSFWEKRKFRLVLESGAWKIIYPESDLITPPDRVLENSELRVFSHGKRKVSINPVAADDVLDRPDLTVISVKLVKKKNKYFIVGELKNNDYLPASIGIEARVWDSQNRFMGNFVPDDCHIPKILPQENASFKIEIEGNHPPTHFTFYARAVVTPEHLYRSMSCEALKIENENLIGELLNYGSKTVTIPAILTSWYGPDKELLWVNQWILPQNIKSQQKTDFQKQVPHFKDIEIVKKGNPVDFFVNGIQQKGQNQRSQRSLIQGNGFYYDLNVNPFIAYEIR